MYQNIGEGSLSHLGNTEAGDGGRQRRRLLNVAMMLYLNSCDKVWKGGGESHGHREIFRQGDCGSEKIK